LIAAGKNLEELRVLRRPDSRKWKTRALNEFELDSVQNIFNAIRRGDPAILIKLEQCIAEHFPANKDKSTIDGIWGVKPLRNRVQTSLYTPPHVAKVKDDVQPLSSEKSKSSEKAKKKKKAKKKAKNEAKKKENVGEERTDVELLTKKGSKKKAAKKALDNENADLVEEVEPLTKKGSKKKAAKNEAKKNEQEERADVELLTKVILDNENADLVEEVEPLAKKGSKKKAAKNEPKKNEREETADVEPPTSKKKKKKGANADLALSGGYSTPGGSSSGFHSPVYSPISRQPLSTELGPMPKKKLYYPVEKQQQQQQQ